MKQLDERLSIYRQVLLKGTSTKRHSQSSKKNMDVRDSIKYMTI